MTSTQPRPATGAPFAPTRWSIVLSARDGQSPQSTQALETLCKNYWYPLYAFVRRQGHNPHDAEDLTQAFFARLLERDGLASVDPGKGRFRSFLLAALKHFLANEWDKNNAQKRGGGKTIISIDREAAEESYRFEPVDTVSADKIFERRWAMTLLDRTLQRLEAEYKADGKSALFAELKSTITGEPLDGGYAAIAARLNTSEGGIKVAAHRLRQRYREVLRAEISETVATKDELEDELRNLFAALA